MKKLSLSNEVKLNFVKKTISMLYPVKIHLTNQEQHQ